MIQEFIVHGERNGNRFTAPVEVTGPDIQKFSEGDDRISAVEAAEEKFLDSVDESSEFEVERVS